MATIENLGCKDYQRRPALQAKFVRQQGRFNVYQRPDPGGTIWYREERLSTGQLRICAFRGASCPCDG